MKKINEILNEKNFKLVENIKNADLVIEEKEIHGLKKNYKKTKNVYIKKAQKTNKKIFVFRNYLTGMISSQYPSGSVIK